MALDDFRVGDEFWCVDRQWCCFSVGAPVVVAIRTGLETFAWDNDGCEAVRVDVLERRGDSVISSAKLVQRALEVARDVFEAVILETGRGQRR